MLIFLYQTLDGSDGKQARATGTGSALGELFDHGVDSITVVLIAVCVQDAARVSYTDETLWLSVAASTCTFYLSNCSLVAFGRQQFFDVDVQELIVHGTMPVLRDSWSDVSAALDDHGVSLLHGPQLPATHLETAWTPSI